MSEHELKRFAWLDLLWLAFVIGLAVFYPVHEVHAQLTLLAIGAFQIAERWFINWNPRRAPYYSVALKIALSSLLLEHSGGINSSYYLMYLIPVVTAATYFRFWATMFWTLLASASYVAFLFPALQFYYLTPGALEELTIRCLFFFLAACLVNPIISENRRQARRYRLTAEELAETNLKLKLAQEDARRSERLAALGQLSAGLAHELRNPLAIIKGSAETLNKRLQAADPLSAELASYISGEVNRTNSIVTRFLDFARPLKLERRPENITAPIERALKAAHDRWPERQIEVVRNFPADLPQVPIDGDFVEQVFANLFLNAFDAMGDRGGKLSVGACSMNRKGREGVEVWVEDSGPGIPPELRQQIFNPFFTTKKDGVGLGLSIVSKIVDEHYGMICVESGDDGGARFRVFFPQEQ
jgi:two-component system, NtrC family, sensor histidine kinase HydH